MLDPLWTKITMEVFCEISFASSDSYIFFCMILDLNSEVLLIDAESSVSPSPFLPDIRASGDMPKDRQPIDELVDEEQVSDSSETSEQETPVDFKRRKLQSKKSSVANMSAISKLKFSLGK